MTQAFKKVYLDTKYTIEEVTVYGIHTSMDDRLLFNWVKDSDILNFEIVNYNLIGCFGLNIIKSSYSSPPHVSIYSGIGPTDKRYYLDFEYFKIDITVKRDNQLETWCSDHVIFQSINQTVDGDEILFLLSADPFLFNTKTICQPGRFYKLSEELL